MEYSKQRFCIEAAALATLDMLKDFIDVIQSMRFSNVLIMYLIHGCIRRKLGKRPGHVAENRIYTHGFDPLRERQKACEFEPYLCLCGDR